MIILDLTDKSKYLIEYRVVGEGFFPYDMLRYASCWPADSDSVSKMGATGRRTIAIRCHSPIKKDGERKLEGWIRANRWKSFGWTVE